MKKYSKKLLVILLAFVLCFTMFTACGGTMNSGDGEGEAEGGGDAAAAETFSWKVQAYTATGTTFYEYAEHLCNLIETMSGGRIDIDLYGSGELVAAFDVPNAIRDGILDAEYGYAGLWTSVEYGMALFCSTPCEFSDPFDVLYWLEYGGGYDIWRETIAQYDCTVYAGGILDAENFLWSDEKIESVEDLQKLQIRMMPVMGDILAANGVSCVFLAGDEVVSSMERKVIDAGEYSTSALDETFGFQDVAHYYYKPGLHQPTSVQEFVISNKAFDALPEDLQAIVVSACQSNLWWTWMENGVRNSAANVRFKDMGRQQIVFDDEMVATITDWVVKWFDQKEAEDPFIKRVRESQKTFMQWWVPYKEAMDIPYADWTRERADEMPFNLEKSN